MDGKGARHIDSPDRGMMAPASAQKKPAPGARAEVDHKGEKTVQTYGHPVKKQVRKSKKSWLLVTPLPLKSALLAKKPEMKSKKS